MANATLTTLLSPLSPALAFAPCINGADCSWTSGWKQGWANDGAWSGLSERYAEGWAVGSALAVSADLQGTGFSVLVQPTTFYNLTVSVNGTVRSSLADLSSMASANVTGLPFGTHAVDVVFQSVDGAREPSQEGVARLTGIEVHWDGSSVDTTTVDDATFFSGAVALSSGWNLLSDANPTANVLNATQAALLEPLLSSAANNSLSWTTQPDATISLAFSGNDLTVYAPLSPMAGSFVPSVDGTAYAAVSAGANVGADDEITGGQVLWAVSGLADGNHTLELRNGGGDGGVGMLIVDYFRFATVGALAATTTTSSSAAVASSSAGASSSTAAAAAAASSSSSSSSTAGTASGISNSASIGIYAAAAVGGLALLGLLILTLFKWRRRRSASAAYPSSPAPPASAGRRIGLNAPSSYIGAAGGGGRGSTTNPAPFQTSDGPSRAFHPLAESSTAGDMAEVGAGAAPIWAARQKSVRRPSGSGGAGAAHADQLDARGLPKPAYEQPLEMPVVPRRLADDGGAEGDGSHRPSIVSFGAATQVATTLRSPTALLPSGARPKSSAAEIGDFGGADAGGLTVPQAARAPGSFRDSRSVYSNDVASAGPSSPGANDGRFADVDVGHGQSVYSLGQYYDGEPAAHDADADDDGGSSYYGAGAGRESRRSSAAEGLHIATGGQWDEAGPAPLTPPMEDPPSARRRNPAANGKGTPDTFGNPLGNYF